MEESQFLVPMTMALLRHSTYYQKQTCYDGKTGPCQPNFCKARGQNSLCCRAQKILKGLEFIQESINKTFSDTEVTSSSHTIASSNDLYIYMIVVAAVGALIVLALVWKLYKTNKELRYLQRRMKNKDKVEIDDSDSGCADGSAFSSSATTKSCGLLTSRESLNKKKIHSSPEENQTHIEPGNPHRICFDSMLNGQPEYASVSMEEHDENEGDTIVFK